MPCEPVRLRRGRRHHCRLDRITAEHNLAVDSKAVGDLSLPVIFKIAFQVTVSRAVTQPNTNDLRLAACVCDQEIASIARTPIAEADVDVAAALVLLSK